MSRPKIEIDLAEVERLAGLGLTQEEIALSLGISERTLYNQKKVNAVFAGAIKKGKATAATEVANQLFQKCKNGDLGAIIWFEKTRRGLSDRMIVQKDELDTEIKRELARVAGSEESGDARPTQEDAEPDSASQYAN